MRALKAKGAALKATEQPIDTSAAAGKCFLAMLGVFAEFETNLRRERQLEGIAKAKATHSRWPRDFTSSRYVYRHLPSLQESLARSGVRHNSTGENARTKSCGSGARQKSP